MTTAMVALCALLIGFAAYYLGVVARRPQLIYQANAHNAELLARLPRLTRRFWATPWAANGHLQIFVAGIQEALSPRLVYDRVETLRMSDGGTTALHWLGADLPAHTPTLAVLHTITGTPQNMRVFVRDMQRLTGWRIVLCERRGHGELPLTSPRFNTLGDTEDLREQLRRIGECHPHSPLYAAGISAGTGLLVRYLGEQGDDTPLHGAFAYCPGYDIKVAFARSRAPYSRVMARRLVRQFVTRNREALAAWPSLARLEEAQSLDEFHQHLYECAGYDSWQAYLDGCNPVALMERISVPLLVLNAEDDPVCVADNVREHEHAMARLPRTLLAVTSRGSHCAYLSGLTARPWAHHLAAEFLQAVHAGRAG